MLQVGTYRDVGDPEHTVGKQLYENGYMAEAEHRDYGTLKHPAPATVFSDTPQPAPGSRESWHAPYVGEHTAAVLSELGERYRLHVHD